MVAKATTTLLQTSSVIIFIKKIFLKTDLVSGVNFWTIFVLYSMVDLMGLWTVGERLVNKIVGGRIAAIREPKWW